MNPRKIVSICSVVALFAGFAAGQAQAQFAEFSGGSFKVTNPGNVATSPTSGTQVLFHFDIGPYAGVLVPATLTLSATKTGTASQTGSLISENLINYSETITADAPFHGFTDLLTLALTSGTSLTGVVMSPLSFITLSGSNAVLTSDFLTFTGGNTFTTAFNTTATPKVTGGKLNTFSSQSASGSGGFTTTGTVTPTVPEPGTISMLIGIAVSG